MDVNYMHPEIKDQGMILNLRTCTVVIHNILWKFANLRLTSPSGPIRYTILTYLFVVITLTKSYSILDSEGGWNGNQTCGRGGLGKIKYLGEVNENNIQ